jgi:hypothetical protein
MVSANTEPPATCRVDSSPCLRCSPGTFAPRTGLPACLVCPPGSYSSIYGAVSCSPCVHGSYAARPSSRACHLCPLGFTTSSDGAVVCDAIISQTVIVGSQYALSVMFSLRLVGAQLEDVQLRTGVAAPAEDVLRFLASLDAATAFNVSIADVQVLDLPNGPYMSCCTRPTHVVQCTQSQHRLPHTCSPRIQATP